MGQCVRALSVLCSFDGIPVAKLPFDPPNFVRKVAHRNLAGEDFTDCSMVSHKGSC